MLTTQVDRLKAFSLRPSTFSLNTRKHHEGVFSRPLEERGRLEARPSFPHARIEVEYLGLVEAKSFEIGMGGVQQVIAFFGNHC